MGNVADDSYYTSRTSKLLRTIGIFQIPVKWALSKQYKRSEIKEIIKLTREKFISLIPTLPYIGGDENGLTNNLVLTGWVLSFYRILNERGVSVDEVGRIIYKAVHKGLSFFPTFLIRLFVKRKYSSQFILRLKSSSKRSQMRQFQYDFVFDVIDGDGREFDLGVNYTECGICKYLRSQNALELAPHMCSVDFAVSSAMGLNLKRSKTLANGDDLCDFRFKW